MIERVTIGQKGNIVYCLSISYINETTKTLRQEMVKRILNLNVFYCSRRVRTQTAKESRSLPKSC